MNDKIKTFAIAVSSAVTAVLAYNYVTKDKTEKKITERVDSAVKEAIEKRVTSDVYKETADKVVSKLAETDVDKLVKDAVEENCDNAVKDAVKKKVETIASDEIKAECRRVTNEFTSNYNIKSELKRVVSDTAEEYVKVKADSMISSAVTRAVNERIEGFANIAKAASTFKSLC